jgi:hypothetical protein
MPVAAACLLPTSTAAGYFHIISAALLGTIFYIVFLVSRGYGCC